MFTTILRRGGAWRIAALAVLAASILSFGAGRPASVNAHTDGQGLCSVISTPVAQYIGQYTNWTFYPGWHFHEWMTIGGYHAEFCGLLY
jgi:hypothetical protein